MSAIVARSSPSARRCARGASARTIGTCAARIGAWRGDRRRFPGARARARVRRERADEAPGERESARVVGVWGVAGVGDLDERRVSGSAPPPPGPGASACWRPGRRPGRVPERRATARRGRAADRRSGRWATQGTSPAIRTRPAATLRVGGRSGARRSLPAPARTPPGGPRADRRRRTRAGSRGRRRRRTRLRSRRRSRSGPRARWRRPAPAFPPVAAAARDRRAARCAPPPEGGSRTACPRRPTAPKPARRRRGADGSAGPRHAP